MNTTQPWSAESPMPTTPVCSDATQEYLAELEADRQPDRARRARASVAILISAAR